MSAPRRTWGAQAPTGSEEEKKPNFDEMDNKDIIGYQKAQMQRQDEHIEQIGESIKRQKNIAVAINVEVNEQTKLLDRLDAHVDKSSAKVDKGTEDTRQVTVKAKQTGMLCTILILFLIIIALIIFVLLWDRIRKQQKKEFK